MIQAFPSGPVMTPWGADPAPSLIVRTAPVAGSRCPSVPSRWPVYQTPPSARRRDVMRMRAGDDVELPDPEIHGRLHLMASWSACATRVGTLDGVVASGVAAMVGVPIGVDVDDPPPHAPSINDKPRRPRRLRT